ncbi:hypothetical protein GCM10009799_06080 [Nocardiopsis rhodophaea]|uniref:N-acetylmuramoyl-L-alanine amidase n=1 Tax=Nocardiopsis rhodophaea TaxID=280238 RepID=A0ABP5DNT5_9ACTN
MRGHRDINSTSCPGDQLYAGVKSGMPVDRRSTDSIAAQSAGVNKGADFSAADQMGVWPA